MSSPPISEADMRNALGLASSSQRASRPAKDNSQRPKRYTLVELSVRAQSGGPAFRFEHRSDSISTLEARIEAEQAARQQGLVVWVLLDIRQICD